MDRYLGMLNDTEKDSKGNLVPSLSTIVSLSVLNQYF